MWELQREAGTAGAVFEMIGEEESDRVGIETHGGRSRPRVRGAKSAEVGVADKQECSWRAALLRRHSFQ